MLAGQRAVGHGFRVWTGFPLTRSATATVALVSLTLAACALLLVAPHALAQDETPGAAPYLVT